MPHAHAPRSRLSTSDEHENDLNSSTAPNQENEVWENSDQWQLHDLVGSSNQVRVGNRSFQKSSDNRELHADEEQAIQRWKERDENFDSMLDQIALVCDRLNPLVHQIGDAAQRNR